MTKSTYRNYVQLFLPARDKYGNPLPEANVTFWKERIKGVFRSHVKGFHVSPYYRVEGDFLSSSGEWISEPNYIIKAFAPRKACKELIEALEEEVIQQMGVALKQESVALESSLEGLALYDIQA